MPRKGRRRKRISPLRGVPKRFPSGKKIPLKFRRQLAKKMREQEAKSFRSRG